ncbi:hypothetical protein SCP_1001160 [Sparassis crispa]|uniref:Tc1-like transposase DDE domain-containing protein n=1 Tax=Sparassis crispa TaxID=139825 RepID=A0A401GYG4_9APHY|nr:hypothetical protein SCP_1001160 [Sparassis crispa]GBE86874.1 hypothetical protein SCP_1001160 [Sparassis crispa]
MPPFGNRRHIPRAVKETLVVLSGHFKTSVIARTLDVNLRTVQRILQLAHRSGSVVRTPLRSGRPRILNGLDAAYLESCIERTPDLYFEELQVELYSARGILASCMTIARTLRHRGFTQKNISVPALERNEDHRDAYLINIGEHYRADQLVFVDKSACNRFTTRRTMAWARIGHRARRHDRFVRGKRYSVLPALSLDGVLHLDVQDHTYKAEEFNSFIDGLLDNMNPFPQPNSVIVMDNASIHKSQHLADMIEARGMRLLYLPPYSPDFNPIEEAFSAMKAWIRLHRDYVCGELTGEVTCDPFEMLWRAVFSAMTPEKALGWFRDCKYVA